VKSSGTGGTSTFGVPWPAPAAGRSRSGSRARARRKCSSPRSRRTSRG